MSDANGTRESPTGGSNDPPDSETDDSSGTVRTVGLGFGVGVGTVVLVTVADLVVFLSFVIFASGRFGNITGQLSLANGIALSLLLGVVLATLNPDDALPAGAGLGLGLAVGEFVVAIVEFVFHLVLGTRIDAEFLVAHLFVDLITLPVVYGLVAVTGAAGAWLYHRQ